MRRYERQPRRRTFPGGELPRLMSMIVMLLVLFLLINRARDPNVWRWLASNAGGDENPPAADDSPLPRAGEQRPSSDSPLPQAGEGTKGTSIAPPKPLVATGPTDQDGDEAEYMKEAFQAVTDLTLENSDVEMPAYERLVQWSLNQPFELMNRRAQRNVLYTQLVNGPDEFRGKLIRLNLLVRRAVKWDLKVYEDAGQPKKGAKPSKIIPLYEVWASTPDSGDHLYDILLVDLPKGMPTGDSIEVRVEFVGYFFKVQKYYDGLHRVNRSPVLIGRANWQVPAAPGFQRADRYITWAFSAAMVLIIGLSLAFMLLGRRRRRSRIAVSGSGPAARSVEEWFDRAEDGRLGEGSAADPEHDATLGEPKSNGQTGGNGKAFPRGLDADDSPGG